MRRRRRDLLRAAAVVATGGALATGYEALCGAPYRLDVSHHALGRIPTENGGRAPLRIAHVSDLHLTRVGPLETTLLERLERLKPGLIVLTGDSVDRPGGAAALAEFLAACPRGVRKLAILGNWEYTSGISLGHIRDLHERHDVELLVNRSVTHPVAGTVVRITGLDDLRQGCPDAAAALADAAPCAHHLVLAHCPALRDVLALPEDHPATAVLSGHTHGGQIAPGGLALLTPGGSGRYVAGWYRDGTAPPLFVSRGVGTSTIPVRLGSLPELACIDWHLA